MSGGRLGMARPAADLLEQFLGDALGRMALGRRRGHAHHADALAALDQEFGHGEHQNERAILLRRAGEIAFEHHRRRLIRPQPSRVRRLPFALAHEQAVGGGRAAPVDQLPRVALLELAELPEGLAGSGAAAAVDAEHDGHGDAARFEHERGQAVGERERPRLQVDHLAAGAATS